MQCLLKKNAAVPVFLGDFKGNHTGHAEASLSRKCCDSPGTHEYKRLVRGYQELSPTHSLSPLGGC